MLRAARRSPRSRASSAALICASAKISWYWRGSRAGSSRRNQSRGSRDTAANTPPSKLCSLGDAGVVDPLCPVLDREKAGREAQRHAEVQLDVPAEWKCLSNTAPTASSADRRDMTPRLQIEGV